MKTVENVKDFARLVSRPENYWNGSRALVVDFKKNGKVCTIEGCRINGQKKLDVGVLKEDLLVGFIYDLVEKGNSFSTPDGGEKTIIWRKVGSKIKFYPDMDETGKVSISQSERVEEAKLQAIPEPKIPPPVQGKTDRLQKKRGRKEKSVAEIVELKQQLLSEEMVIGWEKIPVDEIRPFKNQPRIWFDEESLGLLAQSLNIGQAQLITVMVIDDDPDYKYELVDGERRWRSAKKAGKKTLMAIILRRMDEKQQFLRSTIANFGSQAHVELEEVNAVKRLREFEFTAKQISAFLSKPIWWVNQRMQILQLDPEVFDLLHPRHGESRLRLSHARALSLIKDRDEQIRYAKRIVAGNVKAKQVWLEIRESLKKSKIRGAVKHSPRDDRRQLEGMLDRFQRDLEAFMRMSRESFNRMFDLGGSTFKLNIQEQAEDIIQSLEKLNKRIDDV